jgi:hypothetical protein
LATGGVHHHAIAHSNFSHRFRFFALGLGRNRNDFPQRFHGTSLGGKCLCLFAGPDGFCGLRSAAVCPRQQHDHQSLVPVDKRARARSYYTLAHFGASQFDSLLAGALAHRIGAPHTVLITGSFCIVGALWFNA